MTDHATELEIAERKRAYIREWKKRNREKVRDQKRRYKKRLAERRRLDARLADAYRAKVNEKRRERYARDPAYAAKQRRKALETRDLDAHKLAVKRWREENPERVRTLRRRWEQLNPGKVSAKNKRRSQRQVELISDSYARRLLSSKTGGIAPSKFPEPAVEAQRQHLRVRRLILKLKRNP